MNSDAASGDKDAHTQRPQRSSRTAVSRAAVILSEMEIRGEGGLIIRSRKYAEWSHVDQREKIDVIKAGLQLYDN